MISSAEIDQQKESQRKSSLKGSEAKEELERVKKLVAQNRQENAKMFERNSRSSLSSYKKEILPKPKKLAKRIDNPWIQKLASQGLDASSQRCELSRVMREIPKNIPQKINTPKEKSVSPPSLRELPPDPISRRKLPDTPPAMKVKRSQSVASSMITDARKVNRRAKRHSFTMGLDHDTKDGLLEMVNEEVAVSKD